MHSFLRPGRIADPIYGYVDFSGIERHLLDHRVSQRLRYVAQNGLAQLVFPEMRSSRFSHSLGAMHLATRFLATSLRNASEATRLAVCSGLHEAVQEVAGPTPTISLVAAPLLQDPALVAWHYAPESQRAEVVLAEQGLRLAALFHDLGHLPYSHDFEAALEEYLLSPGDSNQPQSPLNNLRSQHGADTKAHEHLGHAVARVLLKDVYAHIPGNTPQDLFRIPFEVAIKILTTLNVPTPTPTLASLMWLHSLMAGDVDTDRCDYILRDGRNYGFEFAAYDLERLLDNITVIQVDSQFRLAVKPKGLSALETFLLARYRSYQHGVWHHKVALAGQALTHSIVKVLRAEAGGRLSDFLADLARLSHPDGRTIADDEVRPLLYRYATYDDYWWMQEMRRVEATDSDEWLRFVCWREKGPVSLWKRSEHFPFPVHEWNKRLPDPADIGYRGRWYEATRGLEGEQVLVVRHYFSPWKQDRSSGESELTVAASESDRVPVSVRSPLIGMLPELWAREIQVHAFAGAESPLLGSPKDVLARLPLEEDA